MRSLLDLKRALEASVLVARQADEGCAIDQVEESEERVEARGETGRRGLDH